MKKLNWTKDYAIMQNSICDLYIGKYRLHILNDGWGFGLGFDYYTSISEEREQYKQFIKDNAEQCFNEGVYLIDDNNYVISVYNNRQTGMLPEGCEEDKRNQREDIEMIAPIISLWMDKAINKEL